MILAVSFVVGLVVRAFCACFIGGYWCCVRFSVPG